MDREEFYQTIIAGLAQYRDDAFYRDVLATVTANPDDLNLAYSLNKNQVASKCWLLDELRRATDGAFGTVYVLGGWYGMLAAMLLQDSRFDIDRVISFDVDPACEVKARQVNRTGVSQGRFLAVTGDIGELDYGCETFAGKDAEGEAFSVKASPDLIINTSCEHLDRFDDWYRRVPGERLLVLQSNNYFSCDEHVNCVPNLQAFRLQAPMAETLYAGVLPRKRYDRFMLIGRK